jgi:hypothetical protein
VIENCFVVAYVAFACALVCIGCSIRHAVRHDLRAVLDDLSGRKRQRGLEDARRARATAARVRSGSRGESGQAVASPLPDDAREVMLDEGATELCDDAEQTALGEGTFVLVDRLMMAHGQDGRLGEGGA